jgi:hypothetical protein
MTATSITPMLTVKNIAQVIEFARSRSARQRCRVLRRARLRASTSEDRTVDVLLLSLAAIIGVGRRGERVGSGVDKMARHWSHS